MVKEALGYQGLNIQEGERHALDESLEQLGIR